MNIVDKIKSSHAYKNYSRILPYVKPYWFRALLAVLICIPIGALNYAATYLNTWVGGKITNDLKFSLYKKMLHTGTEFMCSI